MAVGIVVAVSSSLLTACSSAGATTCADYGALTWNEREDVLRDLLKEHRLEPMAVGNSLGVKDAVNAFCGTSSPIMGADRPATQNQDRPIEESHDWDSPHW